MKICRQIFLQGGLEILRMVNFGSYNTTSFYDPYWVNIKRNISIWNILYKESYNCFSTVLYSVLYDINRTIMWCSFSRGPIYLDHKRRSNRLVRYGSVMTQRFLEGSLSVLYIPHRRSKMSQLLSFLVCTIKL